MPLDGRRASLYALKTPPVPKAKMVPEAGAILNFAADRQVLKKRCLGR
jgi:hypothetical protein